MSPDPRQLLAKRQEELLLHLIGDGDPPAGFDARRLAAAAHSLQVKRTRAASCPRGARSKGRWRSLLQALFGRG